MVTGTTASSSHHSIMTGVAVTPIISVCETRQIFGMAGIGEAGAVEHGLRDRIGHDRRSAALARHRATARRIEASETAALVSSGRPAFGGGALVERNDGQGGVETSGRLFRRDGLESEPGCRSAAARAAT